MSFYTAQYANAPVGQAQEFVLLWYPVRIPPSPPHALVITGDSKTFVFSFLDDQNAKAENISPRPGRCLPSLVSTQINAHGVITTSTHHDHNLDLQTTSCSLPYCVSMHTTRMLYPCTYIDLLQPRPIKASDIEGSLGCGKSPLQERCKVVAHAYNTTR